MLKDVDANSVSRPGIHVGVVFASPSEAVARAVLKASEVNAFAGQHVEVSLGEVLANNAGNINGIREDAGCESAVGERASEQSVLSVMWSDDVVDADGARNENGHGK